MKRGRKDKRKELSQLILAILSDGMARSINSITAEVTKRTEKKVSWNTVQKYLQELVEAGRISGHITPHSKIKGKDGLTVYQLKK